jgi:hypothetical protein
MKIPTRMRMALLALAGLGAGAALGPTLAGAAVDSFKDVLVRNTASDRFRWPPGHDAGPRAEPGLRRERNGVRDGLSRGRQGFMRQPHARAAVASARQA